MSVKTLIRLADPLGQRLTTISSGFIVDYLLNCAPGAVGVMELTASPAIDPNLLFPDGQLGVYRSIDGGIPYLDNGAIFLLETIEFTSTTTFLRAFHMNTVATRRYVLYANGSTFANKSPTFADDLIKAYWRENAGALIDASREGTQTQADISAYIATDPNLSQGALVGMNAANEPLNNVLQRICDASEIAGTYLTFEIISDGGTGFYFRTYTVARGYDRRYGTSNPVILDEKRGNLAQSKTTIDYHSHVTAAVALGATQVTGTRIYGSSIDPLITLSPFHRIEGIVNNSNVSNTAVLNDGADSLIRNARPIVSTTGKLVDTAGCTRGIHYDLGDMLSVRTPQNGALIDVRLDLVHEHIDASGTAQGQDLTSHQVQHRYSTGGMRSI
jgi:hypothetical protein